MRTLSPATSAKLFVTGFTIGPVVDSLHNQCLLKYDMLPISLEWPSALAGFSDYPYYFCSSWTVPPLLGIAYVVLGGVLPRIFEALLQPFEKKTTYDDTSTGASESQRKMKKRAFVAVTTTALIIKLSELLETNPGLTDSFFGSSPLDRPGAHLVVMLVASLSQWAFLDGTVPALFAASITSVGGPLSELPFVANGFWEYLDQAADYFPLLNVPSNSQTLQSVLGENYQNLALSSITGPCYFAVTMDAIALGRWFDSTQEREQ